jgi:hypothetical protein
MTRNANLTLPLALAGDSNEPLQLKTSYMEAKVINGIDNYEKPLIERDRTIVRVMRKTQKEPKQ